jgi:hypothetical protein
MPNSKTVTSENTQVGEFENWPLSDLVGHYRKEIEEGNVEGVDIVEESDKTRLTGHDLAGDVPDATDYVNAAVQVFDRIHTTEYSLSELESMNDVMVGVFARMYHMMIAKQKDYGPENISKAGIRGVVTRANDKIERLKTLVGDPEQQMGKVQDILGNLPEDATEQEMAEALTKLYKVAVPQAAVKGENIEDTLLDLANYGLIGYMLYMGAWGHPLENV